MKMIWLNAIWVCDVLWYRYYLYNIMAIYSVIRKWSDVISGSCVVICGWCRRYRAGCDMIVKWFEDDVITWYRFWYVVISYESDIPTLILSHYIHHIIWNKFYTMHIICTSLHIRQTLCDISHWWFHHIHITVYSLYESASHHTLYVMSHVTSHPFWFPSSVTRTQHKQTEFPPKWFGLLSIFFFFFQFFNFEKT